MENSLDNSEPALALEPAESLSARDSASEEAGAWWFHALLRCGEWDPKHFTHILDKCVPKFADTLAITAILSYACRDRSTAVPAGYVAIEGYLKIESARQARLGTLQRRLQHPDLAIDWTPIRMGRAGRYTGHECIQRFHRETALPPAGVLQTSAAAEGPRLRVDYRGDSDAPLNRGGWSGRTSARRGNGAGAAVDSPVTDGDPVTGRAAPVEAAAEHLQRARRRREAGAAARARLHAPTSGSGAAAWGPLAASPAAASAPASSAGVAQVQRLIPGSLPQTDTETRRFTK